MVCQSISKNNIHLHSRLTLYSESRSIWYNVQRALKPPFSQSISRPYDNKSFILKPCHPVMEESVRLSQAEYKILQRFYHCSAQSNVRSKSAPRLHEDIFTQQQHLCLSSEVCGSRWSLRDSRHWFPASRSGILKEQRYLEVWVLQVPFTSLNHNQRKVQPFVDYG
jgi:hypothetical protein